MAAKNLMDPTITSLLFLLLLLLPATGAKYVSREPVKTQAGIMPMDGVSPVPTEAPRLNGIPNELRKRAIYSTNWCGMIDGNPQDVLSCPPNTPCILQSSFYIDCCNSLNLDLCFGNNYVLPTTCFDSSIYTLYTKVGILTRACSESSQPYCITFTSPGLISQFGCAGTSYPRTHSFVPISAYDSALSLASSITVPYTTPAQIPTTTPVSGGGSNTGKKPKSRLSKSAKAGIGSAAGLVTFGIITFLSFCFRRRRNKPHVSPTDGDAGPVMAQTNKSAAQPVQQQYQPQPQDYQGAALPVQQQHQPQPQASQNAIHQHQPIYTSGSQ